jgi:hypothetical protein
MGTVTVAVPPSVSVRPTVWALDLITKSACSLGSRSASTWDGTEGARMDEDGIKSSSPFRIDPSGSVMYVAWETRRPGITGNKQPTHHRPFFHAPMLMLPPT